STGDVQNLTVSALLMRLMGSSGAASGQVEQLLAAAKELGLADLPVSSVAGTKVAPAAVSLNGAGAKG
ncbi:hypothetical protein GTW37_31085, partial [Streptomyces sp. SID4931]|nr:hypothetical protein [Streptomyces sp. SID4931]